MKLRFLSLFSGIEAASVAWKPLGWECAAVAEIEPFPCAALAHHYPKVPNLGDVTKITRKQIKDLGNIDVVIFGSPCQDLSVAGKRAGLKGERSGLFFDAVKIVKWAHECCGARFALWENVPGAFSSNQGRDFAEVVGELAGVRIQVPEHGWGTEGAAVGRNGLVEWSTLDAQWFGVAQRRRRVFALLDFGDWQDRRPILLEPDRLRGDSAPSREAGQGVATTLESRTRGGVFPGTDGALGGHVVGSITRRYGGYSMGAPEVDAGLYLPVAKALTTHGGSGGFDIETETPVIGFRDDATTKVGSDVMPTITAEHGRQVHGICATGEVFHALRAEGHDASEDGTGRGSGAVVAFDSRQDPVSSDKVFGSLGSSLPQAQAVAGAQIRRLTPTECERLQGFPDNYTAIPWRKKPADECPDGPRYKALGNSMCTNVIRWIGKSIEAALKGRKK